MTRLLKIVQLGPAVGFGLVLVLLVTTAFPGLLGLLALIACCGVWVILLCGGWERSAVKALWRAHEPTPYEWQASEPWLRGLHAAGIPPRRLFVQRRPVGEPAVWFTGTRSLVASRELVDMLATGRLRADQAVAITIHAYASRPTHVQSPAILLLALPGHVIAALVRGVGQVFCRLPLVPLAVRHRWFVGSVAVVQGIVEGRPVSGILAGIVIALSYLVPAAGHALARRGEQAGDHAVVAAGLGPTYASLLGVPSSDVRKPERLQRLLGHAGEPRDAAPSTWRATAVAWS